MDIIFKVRILTIIKRKKNGRVGLIALTQRYEGSNANEEVAETPSPGAEEKNPSRGTIYNIFLFTYYCFH